MNKLELHHNLLRLGFTKYRKQVRYQLNRPDRTLFVPLLKSSTSRGPFSASRP